MQAHTAHQRDQQDGAAPAIADVILALVTAGFEVPVREIQRWDRATRADVIGWCDAECGCMALGHDTRPARPAVLGRWDGYQLNRGESTEYSLAIAGVLG